MSALSSSTWSRTSCSVAMNTVQIIDVFVSKQESCDDDVGFRAVFLFEQFLKERPS